MQQAGRLLALLLLLALALGLVVGVDHTGARHRGRQVETEEESGRQDHEHSHGNGHRHRHHHGHGHRRHTHLVDRRRPDLTRYHSADQLNAEFKALTQSCPHLQFGTRHHGKKKLTTVTINAEESASSGMRMRAKNGQKLKVLLFFGEHARELISPETALRFSQLMCGRNTEAGYGLPDVQTQNRIDLLLQNCEILLFPLINVDGHEQVARGSYCTRTNRRGVDLNRNWDDHWKRSLRSDTNSGTHAFSESEVVILRNAATAFRPDMFVSIHSGALGMYTPYAYSENRPKGVNEETMVRILKNLNPSYCNCNVGAAGKELSYLCPGTCLDYMYDKLETPYSFAVEIWEGGNGYRRPSKSRSSFVQQSEHINRSSGTRRRLERLRGSTAAAVAAAGKETVVVPHHEAEHLNLGSCFLTRDSHAHGSSSSSSRTSSFLSSSAQSAGATSSAALFPEPSNSQAHTCLSSFNPTNRDDYVATTENWSRALVDLIAEVVHAHAKRD
jgi:hypothetical protein